MKILKILLVSIFVFFIIACSSKNKLELNKVITSFSLSNSVYIEEVPLKVDSPISFGIGLGGYVSKHIGVSASSTVTPKIKNTKALNLQNAIALHNLSLEKLVLKEFKTQLSKDEFYKNKFVPFGADYIINLSVKKYEIDNSIFSSNAHIKIFLELQILNKNADLVYKDIQVNEIDSKNLVYSESKILNDKEILTMTLNESLKNVIYKIIKEMKKN